MVTPSYEEAAKLAGGYGRIPLSMEIYADMETPVRLLARLAARGSHYFLLESADGGEKWGRYSFLGFDPILTVTVEKGKTTFVSADGLSETLDGDPYARIREKLAPFKAPVLPGLPRFTGGAVGYFAYDMVRYAEDLPDENPDDMHCPDCSLMVAEKLIAYDNVKQKIILIVNVDTRGDFKANYEKAAAEIEAIHQRIRTQSAPEPAYGHTKPQWESNMTKEAFMDMVEKAKVHIRDGDIFQVVLSQRFSARIDGGLFDLYRVLRVSNPSPYLYYLKLGDVEVAGASPETLVRLENGLLETCPIAGSRPRGKTLEEDAALEKELLADAKELSEHNMLVDLGRNDIGRVSSFGSVNVAEHAKVMRYSQIMHITSLVTGRLRADLDAFEALRSILPAGTLSGAPKVKAMELIDKYENRRRGLYGGAVGYVGFDGNMDACIAIRTAIAKGGMAYVQSGAGIVADSVPETEYQESLNKARAVLLAAERAGEIQ
ncbi:anthranilate synthase component I [Ethanoligenens harbinense]|uniref:Anthranilate synthase component 1 n=1 Tax=Ethanoligenens harbinense (strain DSM 18485 / JCM 12961 / CGMCC 1.5033 / YUAN-3) TaxID=663278 RepID=E6U693_ETHHY|nr:anthranilate synthase component I [Ethanoligenens harbinense]ADU26860.1 anthranilate synthase component I [Ethanoligenens harbinense YUAN-3]AVQ95962.1 anthranilate synthase component I [Ethanoligenens harbinense YUAN-3]AYF38624.1 anthranilate synthase component I [Ethanoligenens harbinense]AYF41370.1 anthranilate synthase component I [Ethanoligenens harbinense]QCN92203.1 anthranilate synthase component I [Ethanoligenens harbinense]